MLVFPTDELPTITILMLKSFLGGGGGGGGGRLRQNNLEMGHIFFIFIKIIEL